MRIRQELREDNNVEAPSRPTNRGDARHLHGPTRVMNAPRRPVAAGQQPRNNATPELIDRDEQLAPITDAEWAVLKPM